MKPIQIFFSAGEASGDQHAAAMFLELQQQHANIVATGMGGVKMRQAGIELLVDSSNMGVIGVFEVIKQYPKIRRVLKYLQQNLLESAPDLLICVDYKEFNLKLAQFAKQHGIKVLFYVSPQVWAWRPKRVLTYGQAIDMMAVIFPFETAYYTAENIPVRYVGHPSIDSVQPKFSKSMALQKFQLNPKQPIIGLLPGSRQNEIKRLLPVMLQAATLIQVQNPTVQFLLAQADSIHEQDLTPYLSQYKLNLQVIKHLPYDVIQVCNAVMTTSGTITLETALLKIPMVIIYKVAPLTYWLGKCLIQIKMIGLPNIIVGKKIVPELIQHAANSTALATAIQSLLADKAYAETMCDELSQVKQQLGAGGGSKNMATLALEMLNLTRKLP